MYNKQRLIFCKPYLEVEGGNHILPVVVMRRKEDDTLPFLIVVVDKLAVDKMVAAQDAARRGIEVVNALDKEVADMAVVVLLELTQLGTRAVGVGIAQVGARHLQAVAHQIVYNNIKYVGKESQGHRQLESTLKLFAHFAHDVLLQLFLA